MMLKKFIPLVLILALSSGCSSTQLIKSNNLNSMALINGISFNQSRFNNNNAGNGFIITFNDQKFAITAKHVLMIAKTDEMGFVDLEGHLKQWKMYAKNNPSDYLTTEKLLNSNKQEKLEWETLSDDWLVFSIKENKTNYQPLMFREKTLIQGESLYAVGWAYQDEEGPQRTYKFEYIEVEDGLYTLKQITGPEKLAGLSGSPVIDKDGLLVGLVSSGWQDEESKANYMQASKASDIKLFLQEL